MKVSSKSMGKTKRLAPVQVLMVSTALLAQYWYWFLLLLASSTSVMQYRSSFVAALETSLPNIKAAVIVPGFLTGATEFQNLCQSISEYGIPAVAVPMPNWHWLPCLGGRSMRPMLERLDFAVRHMASAVGDDCWDRNQTLPLPKIDYNVVDLWNDFQNNPGGIFQVGGSWEVDAYPIVEPAGRFPLSKTPPVGKIALIGHSAGGWISRIYLSDRNYGGRSYSGSDLVHSLVTLGTPHLTAPGPAFEGIRWCNQEVELLDKNIRRLAVGGTGFSGGDWGALTQGSYAFCCDKGTDGTTYDGDGVTPIHSALGWKGAEQLILPDTTHFCWSEAWGGNLVAPELTADNAAGRPWYGTKSALEQWVGWLDV